MGPHYNLDDYYNNIRLLGKTRNTSKPQEHFYKMGQKVGPEGFIFWRDKGNKEVGNLGKKVRVADFICPKCKEIAELPIAYVTDNQCKHCGCLTRTGEPKNV